jgi:hypothetical protein
MTKLGGILLLFLGASSFALASGPVGVPEIDAGSAATALALLSGGLLILRARRKR